MEEGNKIINSTLIAAIMFSDIFYIIIGSLWIKATASILFVLLGVVNLVFAIKNKTQYFKFCLFLVIGLFFAMLGDIILNINFIIGALLFAVGHIFYFVSYCMIIKFNVKDLIPGAIIFVVSLCIILFVPIFEFGSILMECVCIGYALIISLMVGKAINNMIREKSKLTILIVVGSCLFFFSDLMLLLNVFGSLPKIVDILCLITYYPAECILAMSVTKTIKD